MFSYRAFDLGISSEIEFPELISQHNAANNLVVRLRKLTEAETAATRSTNFFIGETAGVARFLVRDGAEIVVDPLPDIDRSLLGTILLGPVLSLLLRQRGFAVLHASAVAIDGKAVAFLADSGCGKSTLAEAFYKRGYGVVTDDVLAVRVDRSPPEALPGYPSIKLLPDTAHYLQCDHGAAPKVNSFTEKRSHAVEPNFPEKSLPLGLMYVLADGQTTAIEALPPQEMFLELVRNARGLDILKSSDSFAVHIHQCARIVAKVPVLRLRRPRELSRLPELINLIEKDCRRLS